MYVELIIEKTVCENIYIRRLVKHSCYITFRVDENYLAQKNPFNLYHQNVRLDYAMGQLEMRRGAVITSSQHDLILEA